MGSGPGALPTGQVIHHRPPPRAGRCYDDQSWFIVRGVPSHTLRRRQTGTRKTVDFDELGAHAQQKAPEIRGSLLSKWAIQGSNL